MTTCVWYNIFKQYLQVCVDIVTFLITLYKWGDKDKQKSIKQNQIPRIKHRFFRPIRINVLKIRTKLFVLKNISYILGSGNRNPLFSFSYCFRFGICVFWFLYGIQFVLFYFVLVYKNYSEPCLNWTLWKSDINVKHLKSHAVCPCPAAFVN